VPPLPPLPLFPPRPGSAEDGRLLQAIQRGEYAITGFRNRDVRERLFGRASSGPEAKKHSGQTTRRLQLLQAHGLIRRVAHSHRYRITTLGSKLASAVAYAKNSSLKALGNAP